MILILRLFFKCASKLTKFRSNVVIGPMLRYDMFRFKISNIDNDKSYYGNFVEMCWFYF